MFPLGGPLRRRLFSAYAPGLTKNVLFTDHRTSALNSISPEVRRKTTSLLPIDLKQDVRQEYTRTSRACSPHLETLPRFSGILKGFRPGELTIFTGPTGSGKTTVLSQISLDLAAQQVKTLWGSFEVRNTRLVQAMLHQIATEPIQIGDTTDQEPVQHQQQNKQQQSEQSFEDAYERLAQMPLRFMNVFGSTPLEHVLEGMEEAVLEHGTQLIILDNLQFMLSGQGSNNFDKFDLVDQSISAVRSFCNQHPVHVILVVHPRKEIDETQLGLCSVSGTAKATQEADNVVILQKLEGNNRFLDVKKNRFDGELGRVQIGFARHSRMIFELDQQQKDAGSQENRSERRTYNNNNYNNSNSR